MTVSSSTSRADYNGNGVTTSFSVPFYFLDNTHLKVLSTVVSTGVSTTLTLNSNYTVTGAGVPAGGTVLMSVAPASGIKLSILRNLPLTQLYHYVPNDPFPAASHEAALDLVTMEVQQINESVTRAITLPAATTGVSTALPAPVAGSWLGWDATATMLINIAATVAASVSSYMATVLVAANALAARTLLGSAASGANTDITSLNSPSIQSATCATQTVNDNSTKVANTAYADRAANNSANGGVNLGSKIQPILASVASNALTVTLNPTVLDFRSTTLTTGVPNTRTIGAAISLTAPNTATIGCLASSTQYTTDRLVVLAIDNAGTVELAIVNLAGGNNLDETTLINTTVLNTSSTANNVIYSTTARTGVPFRVVGFVQLPAQTVAGTWATAPNLVQGYGGQALASLSSLGYGQTYALTSNVSGVTYYNTTNKPKAVLLYNSAGVTIWPINVGGVSMQTQGPFIVPPNASYSTSGTVTSWWELR